MSVTVTEGWQTVAKEVPFIGKGQVWALKNNLEHTVTISRACAKQKYNGAPMYVHGVRNTGMALSSGGGCGMELFVFLANFEQIR